MTRLPSELPRPRLQEPTPQLVAGRPAAPSPEIPTREIVDQLVATGAIMTRPGSPLVRELVGALRWEGEHTVLWFTAFGENAADAHRIRFDRVEIHPVGACFFRDDTILAFLAPIEKSAVDDVDDYRIAWRLWQEVLPLRELTIATVFDALSTPSA